MPCRPLPPSLILLAACSLAGCETGEKFAPACPSLALLSDAADLTRYVSAERDVRNLALDARITGVPAKCSLDSPGKVRAALQVAFEVNRGPAAEGRRASIPYFVGVTQGSQVLDEQDYTLDVTFPPNTARVQLNSDQVDLLLPVSKAKSAAAYQIYVGFRLSPDELALNRSRGPR